MLLRCSDLCSAKSSLQIEGPWRRAWLRALNEMGIHSIALYSEADAGAPYLEMAGETYAIGPAPARESYLNQDLLLDVVRRSHADGLHPGYGFLSENAAFAQKVIEAGARFIGRRRNG